MNISIWEEMPPIYLPERYWRWKIIIFITVFATLSVQRLMSVVGLHASHLSPTTQKQICNAMLNLKFETNIYFYQVLFWKKKLVRHQCTLNLQCNVLSSKVTQEAVKQRQRVTFYSCPVFMLSNPCMLVETCVVATFFPHQHIHGFDIKTWLT